MEKKSDDTYNLVTDKGSESADLVMFATGRAPNTKVSMKASHHVALQIYTRMRNCGCILEATFA